ncbi:DUF2252 domain-containing protein [Aerosakkonema funiforme]|uniref:DUF2252 domain-containing protein n=2 Tax=Oscillatoriophycideae TaxID=1301283 RepID=A0A926VEH2_9CYAN|nr:DUF2252 domain-containing protein [Aerosakkonema funiforme]MBD2182115.1 DUF2252 domain-containing protein [Aerosakkonema funiforme FACHB-1375]
MSRKTNKSNRQQFIIDVFVNNFGDQMQANPKGWRIKFRKMAASAFAFYRGSAALFYADVADDKDPFLNDRTSRVWIQGDLHAENFGTYMNSEGVLVFDVNDFDESYVGAFTWDVKRLAASLSLVGYQKALSDGEIKQTIATMTRSYIAQVAEFASSPDRSDFALTLSNTTGKLLNLLHETRLNTRIGLLESQTHIENYDRRFTLGSSVTPVDSEIRTKILEAFPDYLKSIPRSKKFERLNYNIKDIVVRQGMGIGSAGTSSYNLLLEGPTQALENDIIIYMKPAQVAAPSLVVTDPKIKNYFLHDGHRTVISQRALQAYSDPWLGYTTLNGMGMLVEEVSPYKGDLEWDGINTMDEILELVGYLGRAVAKIHCVSDVDSDHTLVPFQTEEAIHGVLKGREDKFVDAIVKFGEEYGEVVRDDHRLFVDAFRNHLFPGL